MIRRPPRSTRTDTLFPSRRSSDLGAGADFVRSFDDSPLTLAFGANWRQETYIIHQGDAGSIEVGPTASVFGVGSDAFQGFPANAARSEEHTSELQSLMRISYAVFCLKKKKQNNTIHLYREK